MYKNKYFKILDAQSIVADWTVKLWFNHCDFHKIDNEFQEDNFVNIYSFYNCLFH